MRFLTYFLAVWGALSILRDVYFFQKAWREHRQQIADEMRFWNSLPPGLDRLTVARLWIAWNGVTPDQIAERLFGEEEPEFTEENFADAEKRLS